MEGPRFRPSVPFACKHTQPPWSQSPSWPGRVFWKIEDTETDPLRFQVPPVLYHSELDGCGTTVPISCSRTPASCKNFLIEMGPMVLDLGLILYDFMIFEVMPCYLLAVPFRTDHSLLKKPFKKGSIWKSTPKSNDHFSPKNPRWPLLLLNSSDTQNEPQSCRAAFVIALAFFGSEIRNHPKSDIIYPLVN